MQTSKHGAKENAKERPVLQVGENSNGLEPRPLTKPKFDTKLSYQLFQKLLGNGHNDLYQAIEQYHENWKS